MGKNGMQVKETDKMTEKEGSLVKKSPDYIQKGR